MGTTELTWFVLRWRIIQKLSKRNKLIIDALVAISDTDLPSSLWLGCAAFRLDINSISKLVYLHRTVNKAELLLHTSKRKKPKIFQQSEPLNDKT